MHMSYLRYCVDSPPQAGEVAGRAAVILCRTIEERCGIRAGTTVRDALRIVLALDAGGAPEGFRIADDGPDTIRIAGADERGLLYGVGRFLRDSTFLPGAFVPGAWRGASAPAKPVRGIYFATHFHNYYHVAPQADLDRYVEELALWGCNALMVWFDMHHYRGMDDPDAQAMVARLHDLLAAAERVGMAPGLGFIANEAFAESPAGLRADWTGGHDGYADVALSHYHVELCPHKPGAMDQLLRWRREVLSAFRDVNLKYVWLWPYDQGGCTCAACAPWGGNGFLVCARAVGELTREMFPGVEVVLSTWLFDAYIRGEWDGLRRYLEASGHGLDYVLADVHDGAFPANRLAGGAAGGIPLLNFPEISMTGMAPWGGYGANPRPAHWQRYWQGARDKVAGGFPYSEGMYEDINKILHLQWNWDPDRDAREILTEYAIAYFGRGVETDIVQACYRLEEAMGDTKVLLEQDGQGHDIFWFAERVDPSRPWTLRYTGGRADGVEETLALLESVDRRLPPAARDSWRWRVLLLRARIDREIARSRGAPSDALDRAFEELTGLYGATRAVPCLTPPASGQLARLVAAIPRRSGNRESGAP